MSRQNFRTALLQWAGSTWPVQSWIGVKVKPFGVSSRWDGEAFVLQKGGRAIRVAAKHAFFAAEIAQHFPEYAAVLPAREIEGVATVDFAKDPDAFRSAQRCVRVGAWLESKDGLLWVHKDQRAMLLDPRHFPYTFDMAEKFELYFTPLVPHLRDGVQVVDFSRPGIVQTYAGSGLSFEMASFPEEEEAIEEYLRWYRPKAGDLVFDMGAHCGVSTYHLSQLVGSQGRVVCFEPDPGNFAILERNIARHALTNVTAEPVAIAGEAGTLAFNAEGTIGSSLSSSLTRDSVGVSVMVKAITLADAYATWGVPAFCKIDIEGAEVDVLRRSEAVLRQHPTQFALDTNHPKPDGQMTDKDVEEVFRRCGYETMSEAKPLLTTWARPKA